MEHFFLFNDQSDCCCIGLVVNTSKIDSTGGLVSRDLFRSIFASEICRKGAVWA